MNTRYILVALLLFTLLAPIISLPVSAEAKTITIAVDLAHGEKDKYLGYIQGNITQVVIDGVTYNIKWINITQGTSITSDLLASVDILLIGQPTTDFTPDEMQAIKTWLGKGNKALYIGGDSDYGGGPATISAVNDLLEYLGAKLRLEHAGVYSDVNITYTYKGVEYPVVAGAYYRMLAFIEPDNISSLYTSILDEGVTKPILMHGPTAVIWIDEKGKYHDPVNETYPGLIRIAWYHKSYIGENQGGVYLYDPLFYGQGTGYWNFIGYAAEYWSDKNVIITVAGESLYGDYEPAWASSYYGVALDGPKFVTNLIRWWIKIITTPPVQRVEVLSFTDPEGDDKGTGTLMYPTNAVFQPGVFDLVKFQVFVDNDFVYFKATFKNLGDNPWNGPNGWSLQLLQIYILTTESKPINTSAPGVNVAIYPGWHYLIVATPGWGNTPWPDGELSALYASNGTLLASQGDKFSTYAVPQDNAIEVKVSKDLLGGAKNIESWVFTVIVTSYDGYGAYKVRAVFPGNPQEWQLGGGDAQAISLGIQPLVVDLLAPTAEDQYKMLTSYDVAAKKMATVYGMSKGGLVVPTIITVTVTQSVTTTKAVTQTTTRTATVTQAITQTTTTQVTSTTTITQPEMTTPVIVAVISLIIGIVIGYVIKRPKKT